MRKGKYTKRSCASKLLVVMLSLVLVIGCMVGGTLAWLTAESSAVTNTFTTSDIGVSLKETTEDFQMVPGHTIAKDPKAAVTEGSEKAWLFVKVEKSEKFDDYMTYAIAEGWALVDGDGTTDVYARKVDGTTNTIGTEYSVLKDDKVTVLGSVTKDMMNGLKADDPDTTDVNESTYPTLTFTAYASQLMKDNTTEFTAAEAWANVSNPTGTGTGN